MNIVRWRARRNFTCSDPVSWVQALDDRAKTCLVRDLQAESSLSAGRFLGLSRALSDPVPTILLAVRT
jgi:hypothetical protein